MTVSPPQLPLHSAQDLPAAVTAAAEVLRSDGVVLLPTETFYGLAAAPDSPAAVARISAMKGRPPTMALPVLCADWRQVETLVEIPSRYRVRLSRTWPGPLTVIVPSLQLLAAGSGGTLAVRIPGHPLLRALLYRLGPVTGTSANRHGGRSCTEAADALSDLLEPPDLVLDGGATTGVSPSTLVDISGEPARVIRPGSASWL